ncbi:hypothetical protein U1769_24085 [Sphingomonas sp. ZT3P38]|uniref:hypothetical protein n=1 Tax=Parasphingomonas zepuensis TaxID=3096161 RepID=UPI002FC8E4BC
MTWFEKCGARLLMIGAAICLVMTVVTLKSCGEARTAKTTTKLATGQAGASLASGADAVDTTGAVQGNEIAADAITQENDDAIHNAEGAGAPVAAPVRNAGLASLCRRAAYRGDPKCVQQPSAR